MLSVLLMYEKLQQQAKGVVNEVIMQMMIGMLGVLSMRRLGWEWKGACDASVGEEGTSENPDSDNMYFGSLRAPVAHNEQTRDSC